MASVQQQFATRIQEFVVQVPDEFILRIVSSLQEASTEEWQYLRAHVVQSVPSIAIQEKIEDLLDFWYINMPEIDSNGLALALLAAHEANAYQRKHQNIELVWTGPESQLIPLRRTDQALLQLINGATDRILIVSFAVYKARGIVDALVKAGKRGVSITVLVESPEDDAIDMAYDPIQSFGVEIRSYARFYFWPVEKRPLSPEGRHGSLHAKVAVADGQTLFISSANLTQYAMNLNMEMGVLIQGGSLPGQVEQHFKRMIESGIIQSIDD
jgi:phosphatidylserine/phosphatidylglycerophosphate/cardiolipin synthase-like enzyme